MLRDSSHGGLPDRWAQVLDSLGAAIAGGACSLDLPLPAHPVKIKTKEIRKRAINAQVISIVIGGVCDVLELIASAIIIGLIRVTG